jgi:hypothetical protein
LLYQNNDIKKMERFLVEEDPEGGYTARAMKHSIFTEAEDLSALKEAARDAVRCHFGKTSYDQASHSEG